MKKHEIAAKGELLHGPIVPKSWFKGECSIPTWFLKKLLSAKLGHDACIIHDWVYMLIAILYEPKSIEWQMQLHMADAQLKWNLTLLRKHRRVGRIWGWIYYRGLRLHYIGGRLAVNKDPSQHPRRPVTASQLADTINAVRKLNDDGGRLTEQAKTIFNGWEVWLKVNK